MVFRAPGNGQLNMPAGYSCGPCGLPVLVALQAGQTDLSDAECWLSANCGFRSSQGQLAAERRCQSGLPGPLF